MTVLPIQPAGNPIYFEVSTNKMPRAKCNKSPFAETLHFATCYMSHCFRTMSHVALRDCLCDAVVMNVQLRRMKWVGHVALMGEVRNGWDMRHNGRDEKLVGHVAHMGEMRSGWDMWHIWAK